MFTIQRYVNKSSPTSKLWWSALSTGRLVEKTFLSVREVWGSIPGGEKGIAINAEGFEFDSRVGQIRHSVANGSPALRCFLGAALFICPSAKPQRRILHASV